MRIQREWASAGRASQCCRIRTAILRCGVVAAILLVTPRVAAQYYEQPEYEPLEIRSAAAGLLQCSFSPRYNNPTPDSMVIDFVRAMPVIGFRQGLVNLAFGYTSYPLRGSSRSHLFLGGSAAQELRIGGTRPHVFLLPVMLSIDFTKAEGTGAERDNFNVASVGLGVGVKYRYFSERLDFSVQAGQTIHFSTEGLSTGNGYSAATLGEALLVFRDVGPLDGVIAGYSIRYQTWELRGGRFNYKVFRHGPFVGLVF